MRIGRHITVIAASVVLLAGCTSSGVGKPRVTSTPVVVPVTPISSAATPLSPASPVAGVASAGHVVVVMMENHSYNDIVGNPSAPYLNGLARSGESLTDMFAITHPSEPNYIGLFSGSTQGLTSDACPVTFSADNLAAQLTRAGFTFAGYSEDLPGTGSTVCTSGSYARRHVPWASFPALGSRVNKPLTAMPTNFADLPTVSFVIPNLQDDMHDGTIAMGDAWVQSHLSAYARWAVGHGSLLIVTWDEDDHSQNNEIPTFIVGAGVHPGAVHTRTTLYSVLRLIETRYHLSLLGQAATAPTLPG